MEQRKGPQHCPWESSEDVGHEEGLGTLSFQALLTPWPSASDGYDTLNSDEYTPEPGEPAEVRVCGGSCPGTETRGSWLEPWV